jgi:hypothetical protein
MITAVVHNKLLLASGKAALKSLHELNRQKMMDDSEYVPFVKAAINGIGAHASSLALNEREIASLKESLKAYARARYLELWLENGEEGEDKETASAEGMEYFDYVYKHNKHPEWERY